MFSPTKRELQGTAKSSPWRVWPGHPVVGQPVTLLECVRNVSDVPVYVFEVEGGGPQLVLMHREDGRPVGLRKKRERQGPVQVPLTTRKVSGSGTELMPGDSCAFDYPLSEQFDFSDEGRFTVLATWAERDRPALVASPVEFGLQKGPGGSRAASPVAPVQESATPRFGDEEWKRLVAAGKVADRFQLEVAVSPACRNDIHLIASVVRLRRLALRRDTDLPGRRLFRRRRTAWPQLSQMGYRKAVCQQL